MDRFNLQITSDGATYDFEVIDFAADEDYRCKFEIYRKDRFVASFEPDSRGFLHICKNEGAVEEPILHLIADKLEGFGVQGL